MHKALRFLLAAVGALFLIAGIAFLASAVFRNLAAQYSTTGLLLTAFGAYALLTAQRGYMYIPFGDRIHARRIQKLERSMPPQPTITLLDPDEEVKARGYAYLFEWEVYSYSGEKVYSRTTAYPRVYLTNKRLILEKKDWQYVIPLENVVGANVTERESLLPKLELRFKHPKAPTDISSCTMKIPNAELWKEAISRWRAERIRMIEEGKRARIVVVDFSFLRDYLERGGIVLYTVKCPNCGAPLELPESGNKTVCKHCGATVYAEDILRKINELLQPSPEPKS